MMEHMGGTSDSQEELLEEYFTVAEEHLNKSDNLLLGLERNAANRELLDELFRELHSIKGDSAVMGFGTVEQVAHAAESILDAVRAGEVAVSGALVDALLGANSTIRRCLESARKNERAPEVAALLTDLGRLVSPRPGNGSAARREVSLPDPRGSAVSGSSAGSTAAPAVAQTTQGPKPGPMATPDRRRSPLTEREAHTIFAVRDLLCSVSVSQSYEFIECPPITELPQVEPWILGVFNHQGEILPVIDLSKRLGLPTATVVAGQLLLVQYRQMRVALLVTEVLAVQDFVQPAAAGDAAREGAAWFVSGALQWNKRVVMVLDLDRVLDRSQGPGSQYGEGI